MLYSCGVKVVESLERLVDVQVPRRLVVRLVVVGAAQEMKCYEAQALIYALQDAVRIAGES